MQAFHGDQALKIELLSPVRSRWKAGELFAASMLKWMPDHDLYSISAALIGSEDVAAFEQRTGIPVGLANLCEGIASAGSVMTPDQSRRSGQRFVADEPIADFAVDWLEAIRPGSELSGVQLRFMVEALAEVLQPAFELSEFITPETRAAVETILDLWRSEMAGDTVTAQAWRSARKAAVAASELAPPDWGQSVAHFAESMAWPILSIKSEFVQHYMMLTQQALDFLRMPFLSEEDQTNRKLVAEGWRRIAAAEREQALDEAAMQALLDTMPDIKRAIFAGQDPVIRDRVKSAQIAAFVATTPMLRRHMDRMLKLIEAA